MIKGDNRIPAACFLSVLIISAVCVAWDFAESGFPWSRAQASAEIAKPQAKEKDFFSELLDEGVTGAGERTETPKSGPEPEYPRNVRLAKFEAGELVCIDRELYLAVDRNSLKKLFERNGNAVSCSEIGE